MFSFFKNSPTKKRLALANTLENLPNLRVVIGAGEVEQAGWIPTDIDILNITKRDDWEEIFGRCRIECLMAEHVWEHLSAEDTKMANRFCFEFLKPNGTLRLAVPDGLNPDPTYQEHVKPGGSGPGADDHKILYTYHTMAQLLREAGFEVQLLEHWDEEGRFHHVDWSCEQGLIRRSRRYDPRNKDGKLNYTSLIVDATKPNKAPVKSRPE